MPTARTPIAVAALAAIGLAACAESMEQDKPMAMADARPMVAAMEQPAGGTVTVDEVTMTEPGFVVIHAFDAQGNVVAPASIGHAPVGAGRSERVVVVLDQPAQPGDRLLAMLHHDTGRRGVYEFGPGATAEDKPVVVDGKPVVMPFTVK